MNNKIQMYVENRVTKRFFIKTKTNMNVKNKNKKEEKI